MTRFIQSGLERGYANLLRTNLLAPLLLAKAGRSPQNGAQKIPDAPMTRTISKIYQGFWQYGLAWENYQLLARGLRAAWLIRRQLADKNRSPQLAAAIAAAEQLYLPPQAGWRITDEETILRCAGFIVGVPLTWGRCVQRSLLAYRLLNAYGMPARICFGIHRLDQRLDGHAWVERLEEPRVVLGESGNPYEKYLLVYRSAMPESLPR